MIPFNAKGGDILPGDSIVWMCLAGLTYGEIDSNQKDIIYNKLQGKLWNPERKTWEIFNVKDKPYLIGNSIDVLILNRN